MHRTPNTSDPFIQATHHPPTLHPPQLLPARVPQQLRLLQHLLLFQVPDADRLLPPVDITSSDDWVTRWARGDVDFDLGMRGGEGGEEMGEELTGDGNLVWGGLL